MFLQPFEVNQYSPAGRQYPTDMYCSLIPQVEEELRRTCIGIELWDYMEGFLNDYPASVTEWSASNTYAAGAFVVANGRTYESDIAANTSDPLVSGSDWTELERFTDSACMQLWEKYLRALIAVKVYSISLPYQTFKSNGGGIVVSIGDSNGNRSGKKEELYALQAGLKAQEERINSNMLLWLEENAQTLNLPYISCSIGCNTQRNSNRRWAFRY